MASPFVLLVVAMEAMGITDKAGLTTEKVKSFILIILRWTTKSTICLHNVLSLFLSRFLSQDTMNSSCNDVWTVLCVGWKYPILVTYLKTNELAKGTKHFTSLTIQSAYKLVRKYWVMIDVYDHQQALWIARHATCAWTDQCTFLYYTYGTKS